jgi:MFS family permease
VLSLTLGRLILGGLLKKIAPYTVLITCVLLIYCGILVLMTGSTQFSSIFGLILLGFGFSAGFPVMLGFVGEIYADLSGTAFSIVFVIALVGNIITNYLVGIISHTYGIQHYLTTLLVCVLLMSVLLIIALKRISTQIKI